jgi:hypothetical protein
MSDYLWDKTGEPDADVEQLENLLGALKYQPRPLEIPASAMPTAASARPSMFFSRPRLAIAASLLLTLLAGTWFVTRQTKQQAHEVATVGQGSETVGIKQTEKAVAPNDENGKDDPLNRTGEPEPRENISPVIKVAAHDGRHRAPRGLVAKVRKLQPRRDVENAPAPQELIASHGGMRWQVEEPLTPQQREATEQLMLALRVASAKFNYAQREMQEIGRAGK